MRRLGVAAIVLALAVLGSSTAVAQANSAAAQCNGGLCTGWFNIDVPLHWVLNPDPPDTQTGCGDETISAEGSNQRECDVTWTTGDPLSANVPVEVKIDKTAPTLVAVLARGPDTATDWYNHPVALDLSGSTDDDGSGIHDCDTPVYSTPDSPAASLSGTCTDFAGNKPSPAEISFKYDATAPTVDSAALDRPPDSNGWYNHPVGLLLQGSDATSGPPTCTAPVYSGPDGASAQLNGTCTDQAGNSALGGAPLAYDDGRPEVLIAANRPPDHDGWYNHPVSFAVGGVDGASGIASCAGSTTYAGPDSASGSVAGSCTDVAGNSATASRAFRYDASRPAAASVDVTPGNRRVKLRWSLPADANSVVVVRAKQGSSVAPKVVYSGAHRSFVDKKLKNGTKYSYTITDFDQAGNQTSNTLRAIPTHSSLRPYVGSVVSSPPLLTWKKIKHARYYNIQLYLGKHKVLSKWPRTHAFQMAQTWHYRGKAFTLLPGHYRWYVWPAFGPRSAHRYGHRLGRSSFRVR